MKKEDTRLTVKERKLLKRRVTELMHDMGIPVYIIGYDNTRNAIIKAFENIDFMNIMENTIKVGMKKRYVEAMV